MNEKTIYLLTNASQEGTTSGWKWSLFKGNGNSVPSPPEQSGSDIVSKGMEMIKGMESGNVINNNSTWVSYGNAVIKIAVGMMLIYLLISLVVQGMQLAQYGDNPGMRSKTLENIKRTFIAASILGGLSTIAALCINAFN